MFRSGAVCTVRDGWAETGPVITFAHYFMRLYHFSKITSHKESQNSKNHCFSYYFCFMDPYLWLMDPGPDPGGPKTYGSYGSGSGALGVMLVKLTRVTFMHVMFRSVAVCAVRYGRAEPGPVPGPGRPPQPGDRGGLLPGRQPRPPLHGLTGLHLQGHSHPAGGRQYQGRGAIDFLSLI